MKTFNKYIALSLCAVSLAACQDLDTEYLGAYDTTDQKKESLEKNPELALASVTGIFANYSTYMTVFSNHFDFGYPAIMIGLDSQGQDMAGKQSGYNWYSYWEGWTSPTQSGTPAAMMWYHMYKNIKVCNDLIATIDPATDNDELKFYRAQGLAARAHDYFNLAQTFQFTYKGNETKPCVPIITDLNATEAGANGCGRATVEEVYAQIIADLNEAIDLLTATTITPESVIDSKPKRLIGIAAAYGLRARVNLVMNKWSEAASDAKTAIEKFTGRPYSMAEVSVPTFVSIDDPSWMWGIAIAETDRVVTSGIVNFLSMMGTFTDGYNTAGAWRWCNKLLYESIPTRDVRKGWFLDENYTSTHLSAQQQAWVNDYINEDGATYDADQTAFIMPYTQVKYGTYQNVEVRL
ncbi:RagB/SusD family nutrient uptake outer membrane protein [uncultured Duncaniella sp.]|uniref:RagB/SusD family nutrient uptake outer membrane protein n=1 Tax=uncultured Duncaniella sp. TaxID=2768039 RepID=UPI00272ACCDF|nr:RagB/SusD family nutrient uptake outer membrane protein [uncultured Duncaniella sp.]